MHTQRFLPTTLVSLPSGVMLLNCSTAPRDSATDIEKTSRKDMPERERPNRSVVKMTNLPNFKKLRVVQGRATDLGCLDRDAHTALFSFWCPHSSTPPTQQINAKVSMKIKFFLG